MQRVLLIPDRFSDFRMWGGIPDRLARRAEVSQLDRLMELPWGGRSAAAVEFAPGSSRAERRTAPEIRRPPPSSACSTASASAALVQRPGKEV